MNALTTLVNGENLVVLHRTTNSILDGYIDRTGSTPVLIINRLMITENANLNMNDHDMMESCVSACLEHGITDIRVGPGGYSHTDRNQRLAFYRSHGFRINREERTHILDLTKPYRKPNVPIRLLNHSPLTGEHPLTS